MNVFDEDFELADELAAQRITALAEAGLTLDELRAYWRFVEKGIA